MSPSPPTTRTLSTAGERREAIIASASRVFAERGLSGPTTEVAAGAGISQAYVFRLFPTKTDLAVAVMTRCGDRIAEVFEAAATRAAAEGSDPLSAMGNAYQELIHDRQLLLLQLNGHAAAASDPALRETMRNTFARLYALLKEHTEATDDEISRFFATGMLMNVLAATDAFELDAPWAIAVCARLADD